jgi:integrase/recombinase XerD
MGSCLCTTNPFYDWSKGRFGVISSADVGLQTILSQLPHSSRTTPKKSFEFFMVPIRNANTRAAYYRAIQQFLARAERAGYQDLEDIEPITVAAYIEILQRRVAPPTVKQRMAAIRMLFSWLT